MKNLYNTLKPSIKTALDEHRKTHKYTYQKIKKELLNHRIAYYIFWENLSLVSYQTQHSILLVSRQNVKLTNYISLI